jgi:hypothetical protein
LSVPTGIIIGDCEKVERRLWIRGSVPGGTGTEIYDRSDPLNTGDLRGDDEVPLTPTPPYYGMPPENFESMNLYDKKFDIWPRNTPGRAQAFSSIGSLQTVKSNTIRHSQEYSKGGQVSRLNTFEEFDEYQLPIENGPGTKLQDASDVIVVVSQNEATALYVNEQFVKTSSGTEFLSKSTDVIGDDRKYFGGIGCIHPESIREYGGRVYWFDFLKGVVCRRSLDGVNAVSRYGVSNFLRKFSRDNYANRLAMRFPGGYDPVHDLYLVTAINNAGTVLWTLGFHEPTNSWVGWFDYQPLLYSKLNGFLISFKNGNAWIHNSTTYMNFYGVQYNRTLEFAVAVRGWKVDVWHGISLDADEFYVNVGANDVVIDITNDGVGIITSGTGGQHTTVTYKELKLREGVYRSSILNDLNTPQPFTPAIRAKFEGNPMRGQIIRVKVVSNKTNSLGRIRSVGILYRASNLS